MDVGDIEDVTTLGTAISNIRNRAYDDGYGQAVTVLEKAAVMAQSAGRPNVAEGFKGIAQMLRDVKREADKAHVAMEAGTSFASLDEMLAALGRKPT